MEITASMPYETSLQRQYGYPLTYTTTDIGRLTRFVRGRSGAGAITRLQSALVNAADQGVGAMTTALRSHYSQIFNDRHGFEVRFRATTPDIQEDGRLPHYYGSVRFGRRRFGDDRLFNRGNVGQSMVNSLADVMRQMSRHSNSLDSDFGQAEMRHLTVVAIVAFYSNVVQPRQAQPRQTDSPPVLDLVAVSE